jgi:hypothetical protein
MSSNFRTMIIKKTISFTCGRKASQHQKLQTFLSVEIDSLLKYEHFWEELIAYFSLIRYDRIENDASNNSSVYTCVVVAAITFLLSSCLQTIVDTHIDTQSDGRYL